MQADALLTSQGVDGEPDDSAPQSTQDLTVFVQNLLQQMQGRFTTMSDAIIGRIDDMGQRIDELENSIGELMAQAGIDEEPVAESQKPPTDAPPQT
ncbi:hypothetical protein AB1Y20_007090 [Prymnesium parvum]|uniref:Heat shock factor-binding protein 1 n=1 Tax=Prymnesium parvum TaxID=97485 RepID=A0AB34J1K6_PRYPA